jgi:hypothetical protein
MAAGRDMTKAAFDAACERRGFQPQGFMGYYSLGGDTVALVSVLNAGPRRRDRLAYLIAKKRELEARRSKAVGR